MSISQFYWDEFPLERERFTVCVCYKDKPTKDTHKLLHFLKIIFPSDKTKEISKDMDWVENNNIYLNYMKNKGHLIVSGNDKTISNVLFTTSDIIIFEDVESANKYLSRHHLGLKGFETEKHFILVDKDKMQTKIYAYSKESLNRYL